MKEKVSKDKFKRFVTLTKIIPILIAIIHLLNSILSFIGSNDIPLNYIGGISLLPILYLYAASYVLNLCNYYRMFLHYSILIDIINVYDYYIGIPLNNKDYVILFVCITIISMLIIIKMKFFK